MPQVAMRARRTRMPQIGEGAVLRGARVNGPPVSARGGARHWCACLACGYRFHKLAVSLRIATTTPACPLCLAQWWSEFGKRGRAVRTAQYAAGLVPYKTTLKHREKVRFYRLKRERAEQALEPKGTR